MSYTVRFTGFAALLFYALSWFSDVPSKSIWYIGVSLPWLSLFLSPTISIFCKARDDKYFSAWGYSYVIYTIMYVIVVSLMTGSIWYQLSHISACIAIMSCIALESSERKTEELKKKLYKVNLSSEKALEELRNFDDLYPKAIKLNQILIDILNDSEEKEEKN